MEDFQKQATLWFKGIFPDAAVRFHVFTLPLWSFLFPEDARWQKCLSEVDGRSGAAP